MHKLLSFSLLVAVLPCTAQEFRLSGGYNGSNVTEAGNERWVGQAGYQFGADLLLGNRWFIKPGVHFMVRNLNYSYAGLADVPAQDFRYTSRSLAVPVMLGLRFIDPTDEPALNIYALGGPTALFKLDADLDNDQLDVETSAAQWYLGFGGGLSFGFLFVEGGYNVAMSNVFEGDAFRTNPRSNQVYGIAGVRLRLAN